MTTGQVIRTSESGTAFRWERLYFWGWVKKKKKWKEAIMATAFPKLEKFPKLSSLNWKMYSGMREKTFSFSIYNQKMN